jgi:stage V sporulation protein B
MCWQIILFFLAYELLISIDLYLVKALLRNDYLTGIYNASLTVGRIPYYIFYALTIMLLPVISKTTAQNDQAETQKIIQKSLRLMIILLVPSVILLSKFAKPVIEIFYSQKYLAAAYPMSILVYGVGFLTIFYVMSFVLNGAGKTKIPMWIALFGLFLNAFLNYLLIRQYALVGSAVATTLTSFIIMLIMLFYLKRDFGKVWEGKSLGKIFFAGLLTYGATFFFPENGWFFLGWSVILCAFYFLLLYFLREISQTDWQYLQTIISRKKTAAAREELSGNEPSA